MGRHRLNLRGRTLLLLSAVAAFSTVLALGVQDHVLSADLRAAATHRVERAAESTRLLLSRHLDAMSERYRAISGTPQLRATLEVGDAPTLRFYAERLAAREGAVLVAFVDRAGKTTVAVGDASLLALALAVADQGLVDHLGRAHAVVDVPLRTGDEKVGRLVAVEPLDAGDLRQWSDLCGAEVSFVPVGTRRGDVLERVVLALPTLELRAAVDLEAERVALANSRYNLLMAGGIALALAFGASLLVSRSLVGPILQIRNVALRIGGGDFSGGLDVPRRDEIGDVARAMDGMLDRLREYRHRVEAQHRELEENFEQLSRSQRQLANAQRLAHIGSWRLDLQKGELHGSEEFRSIFGLPPGDEPIDPDVVLARVHADDREGLAEAVRGCIEERATLRLDCRIALEGDVERVLQVQAQQLEEVPGAPGQMEGTVQDVTERKRSEEQIRYLAYRDNLTGLGNRRLCRERLELQLTQARRSEAVVGVLFVGLDAFKRINDTLGHSAGDAVLKGTADRIVACIRAYDFVGRGELENSVSRLGGDEFAVVIFDPKNVQDLATVARRLLEALARPFDVSGHDVVVSASIGIAAYPFDGDDAESLLRNADTAMCHAKEQGRNNHQFYADSMNEVAMRRLVLEGKLRHALERGEFELHYQPKVCLRTGEVRGVEALARWRDPESGLVSPGVFIPIAEETGLIAPLGDWVIETACARIRAWQAAGRRLPVSVNLSTHQFRSGELAAHLLDCIDAAGVDPGLLEVEITESALMHDERALVAELESMRARGVRVSLDDFGTGYSSFAYLRQLPVDALKIDRSFVTGIGENEADAALTASIVGMGRALGLRVIAEGVETERQRDLLAGWGCDEMQGFLYSRPVGVVDLEERLGWTPPSRG